MGVVVCIWLIFGLFFRVFLVEKEEMSFVGGCDGSVRSWELRGW